MRTQLIRAKDQSHLWAQDYDRQPEDVLNVQDDVAVAVMRDIQLRLGPRQRSNLSSARVVNSEAHEAYLKGRSIWNKRTQVGFMEAVQYFKPAIANDAIMRRLMPVSLTRIFCWQVMDSSQEKTR
jgi:hypothetical protein